MTITITDQELNMIRECLMIAAKSPTVTLVGMRMIAEFDAKLVAQTQQPTLVEPPAQ